MRNNRLNVLSICELCPRMCKVDRSKSVGFCGASDKVKIALVSLHKWEEPCLIGEHGAGTIFFACCNLRCVFCQNHDISQLQHGIEVTIERLAEIFLEQQARGAANIELVTPTHYVPQIIEALDIAKLRGLALPVVYNTNAYDTIETIEMLRGYIDIFLPDLKYYDDELAYHYSSAPKYFEIASAAIEKMVDLTGRVTFDNCGQLRRGVIVRHLILPNHRHDSMKVVEWLYKTFGDDIYISLMNQYTPMFKVLDSAQYKKLNRRLTTFEYDSVINYAVELGLKNCYMQVGKTASTDFVPVFDGSGVLG